MFVCAIHLNIEIIVWKCLGGASIILLLTTLCPLSTDDPLTLHWQLDALMPFCSNRNLRTCNGPFLAHICYRVLIIHVAEV